MSTSGPKTSTTLRETVTVTSDCPLCGKLGAEKFQAYGHMICECGSCLHRFTVPPAQLSDHVSAVYGDEYFFGGGAGNQDYVSDEAIFVARARQYEELLRGYCEPGSMLDIGAAVGFTMKAFAGRGWSTTGIEPNQGMAARGCKHLDLDIHHGTLETWQSDEQFDLITMLQVIAHFHSLPQAMAQTRKLTRTGGYLLVETWNYRSLTARLFGQNWHEYSPPSVLNWFSMQSLKKLGKRYGFEIVAQGRPKKTISGSHAKSLLRYRLATFPGGRLLSPLLWMLPNKWRVPYPAEDLMWVLLQKKAD